MELVKPCLDLLQSLLRIPAMSVSEAAELTKWRIWDGELVYLEVSNRKSESLPWYES